MKFTNKKYYEVNENYLTSEFHFLETDIRSFDIIYDDITSFISPLNIESTSEININGMKKLYRYADGFILHEDYVEKVASIDCYGISFVPVQITDKKISISDYYYMKVHNVLNCLNRGESKFNQFGDAFSFSKIVVNDEHINDKDRIFFIDDEYSILMSEDIFNVFDEEDILFSCVGFV